MLVNNQQNKVYDISLFAQIANHFSASPKGLYRITSNPFSLLVQYKKDSVVKSVIPRGQAGKTIDIPTHFTLNSSNTLLLLYPVNITS
jgi:hypothetical protein